MKITKFEEIEGWQKARVLAQALSRITRNRARFPDAMLARQARGCVVSTMANIAEGFDSGTKPEFVRFLRIAYRSMSELQSHLYLALDESFIDQATFTGLYVQAGDTKALIAGFIRYLRRSF
jgi:four helix bundle protein